MGLDMYLSKVRKLKDGVTLRELDAVNNYCSYKERPDEYKKCSMKKWCGINYRDVDRSLARIYRPEYIHRYSVWDTEKKYGWKSIFQDIAYWRKANQIHKWFVDNIQDGNDDCGNYIVTKEQLERLLSICMHIKANPDSAWKHLPTQSGFFFGGTEYDQWYWEDIDYTIKALETVLKETDFDNWIVFYSSSW